MDSLLQIKDVVWSGVIFQVVCFSLKSVEVLGGGRLINRCHSIRDSDRWSLYSNWTMSLVLERWMLMVVSIGIQVTSAHMKIVGFERPKRGHSNSGREKRF